MTDRMTREEIELCFSYVLRKKIRGHGWTQREFAKRTGLSERTIAYYIYGGRLPKYEHILIFADVLDCSIDELMQTSDELVRASRDTKSLKIAKKYL